MSLELRLYRIQFVDGRTELGEEVGFLELFEDGFELELEDEDLEAKVADLLEQPLYRAEPGNTPHSTKMVELDPDSEEYLQELSLKLQGLPYRLVALPTE